ncbi:HEAT repeat domain-containing protein [Alkaliphilus peptidifermentans]|uniref:HEAT repeat-containing protein n=1 Tax=Alkaliphilus peptidifermentans DSM 18978 TaxID=1120976 RepID=A0A1G5DVF1_9FIRM|nr:HEAT repeat domain-containing protein [Alkaliphilus peptidifermentans]SCY18238.1 HEAT repeat-containing protein [Alkaliphilus peptidifermentans DSM 18978]
MKTQVLHWNNVNSEDDFSITYLLYMEGKNIELISRIRNLPVEVIQEHIIQSKMLLKGKGKKSTDQSFFVELLAATKEERIRILEESSIDDKNELINYLKTAIGKINNAEDKMIAIWIAGQIKAISLLPILHAEAGHKHGGVRRMVCSALRKIPDKSNIEVLHRTLHDSKPQVRQYSAKALAEIGDEKTLKRLRGLINNPNELEYVKRSYQQAIEKIQEGIKN